mgnify:CR=1 FL=1
MPPSTTEKGYIIGVKQTGGTTAQSTISFINGRTGNRVYKKTVSNEINTNLNNTKEWTNGYQDGDVIDITGTGLKTGNAIHTVDRKTGGGRVTLAMVDVSTTNAPAISF